MFAGLEGKKNLSILPFHGMESWLDLRWATDSKGRAKDHPGKKAVNDLLNE
ncbi:hypothetical protein [Fictibacillus sp. FJAT-27399]|uniref:hypothetical protein n=1 Tax=Fictibacillus sp. FJAT-27399 TaxID=1729689 RepID=UPI0012E3B92B|nr:hypothetical protein [Fictibacillus sp. FJAT-27399]